MSTFDRNAMLCGVRRCVLAFLMTGVCFTVQAQESEPETTGGADVEATESAEPDASEEAADAEEVTIGEMLDMPELRHEAALAEYISEAVSSEVQAGVSRDIQARNVTFLRRGEAVMAALRKNLSLRTAEATVGVFNQALLEAEAVFLPIFDLSLSYRRSDTHQRTEVGTVVERSFQPQTPIDITTDPNKTEPQIDQLGFNRQGGDTGIREIDASSPSTYAPDEPMTYSVGVTQQLPWGPQVSLFTSLVDRRVYRNRRGESFKADWTASAVLGASVPLPYTRNFGRLAPANFSVAQSELFDERTDWSLRVVLNETMRQVDVAYWQLVRSLENLRIVRENRGLMETQVERMRKLFASQMATEYSKAVVETELARILVQEEAAKNAVVAAGNRLAPLLQETGVDVRSNYYIPADYLESLSLVAEIDFANAISTGIANRPELREAEVDLRRRDLERRFAEVQTRPDIQLDGSISGSQNNDEYGYYEAGDALLKVIDPDNSRMAASMTLTRPWGNVPLKAAHRRAELLQTDQELLIKNLENNVTREVNDALDIVHGARMRLDFAERNLQLANESYERILKRREIGADVTALELVTALQELLSAKSERISALVDNKIAETQLLAAQGVIASRFTSTDANSPFENRRLDMLREIGALRYFAAAESP